MYRLGSLQQKIILLFLAGAGVAVSSSPKASYRHLRETYKEWKKVDQRSFNRSLRKLSNEKLLKERRLADGSFVMELTKEGKRRARLQVIFGKTIHFKKPKKWDGRWRVVSFDIPEDYREFRDILRKHLYDLGFHKLQLSMFVSPYPCEKELQALAELYNAKAYVRVMTVVWLDNQEHLKKTFFPSPKK